MAEYNKDTFTGPSFSIKNRLSRLVWQLIYLFFFKYSPRPLHEWRSIILRIMGAKVGKGVHVYPKVIIWAPWNLDLQDGCGIGDGVNLYCQAKITVGERAIISQGTYVCTGTHDYTKRGHPLVASPIAIKANSWIAAEAFIHPGVTIGEGTVVGARSVVVKDIADWVICAGNPAKVIKQRILID